MKGLLLKDFYTLIKQMKLFLLMIVVFACLPGYSVSAFALVYAAMMPISALAYDERSKWDSLAAMMPYTARDIVFGKYVLGYIFVLGAAALSLAAQGVLGLIRHSPMDGKTLAAMALTGGMALIMQGVNLPLMCKLGVEKGRVAFFIALAMVVGAGALLGGRLTEWLSAGSFDAGLLVAVAIAVALVLNLASVPLATAMYEKRMRLG